MQHRNLKCCFGSTVCEANCSIIKFTALQFVFVFLFGIFLLPPFNYPSPTKVGLAPRKELSSERQTICFQRSDLRRREKLMFCFLRSFRQKSISKRYYFFREGLALNDRDLALLRKKTQCGVFKRGSFLGVWKT